MGQAGFPIYVFAVYQAVKFVFVASHCNVKFLFCFVTNRADARLPVHESWTFDHSLCGLQSTNLAVPDESTPVEGEI